MTALKLKKESISLACERLAQYEITVSGSFIIGGPGETNDTIQETIDLVKKLKLDFLFLWFFVPIIGAPAWDEIEAAELLGDDDNRTGHFVAYVPKEMTKEELEKAYKKIYRAFYLRPSAAWGVAKSYGIAGLPPGKGWIKILLQICIRLRDGNHDLAPHLPQWQLGTTSSVLLHAQSAAA